MPSAILDPGISSGNRLPASLHLAVITAMCVAFFLVPVCVFAQAASHQGNTNAAQTTEESLARGALNERKTANSGPANIENGALIATGKAACHGGQVCGCFQCHGVKGEGNPSAGFPRIAGQSYLYLDASLRNFASGRRVNPIMQPVARQLSPTEMRDVAAYYASLEPPSTNSAAASQASSNPAMLREGGVLAAVGSAKDGVQGCQNCHGPAGAGLPPVYPSLAGQYASYLEGQMQDFRSGKRQGDAFEIMQDIARRLSDQQINAAAEYYSSIHPEHAVTQSKLGPAVQVGAPLGPEPGSTSASGEGQNR
jgi:cytochrome c553